MWKNTYSCDATASHLFFIYVFAGYCVAGACLHTKYVLYIVYKCVSVCVITMLFYTFLGYTRYTRFTGLCWLLRQSCPHFVIFIWVMTPIKSTWLVNKFFESSLYGFSLFFWQWKIRASFFYTYVFFLLLLINNFKLPLFLTLKHTRPISFCYASVSYAIYLLCIRYVFSIHSDTLKYTQFLYVLTKFSTLLNFKFALFIWLLA